MRKRNVLIVIGMQRGTTGGSYHQQHLSSEWWDRYHAVVANIQSLIRWSEEAIFLLDTDFRGKNLGIVQELDLIAGTAVIFKHQDDGSEPLMRHFPCWAVAGDRLLVCGMNTDAGVLQTVRGLVKVKVAPRPVVVGDACWTVYASRSAKPHDDALRRIKKLGVSVVSTEEMCSEH